MPTPEEYLTEIERELVRRGHPKLSGETLIEAYKAVSSPQMIELIDQWPASKIADEIDAAVKSRGSPALGETGRALPPSGGSRIAGEPNLALGDSSIHNLPAAPGEHQFRNPVMRGRRVSQPMLGTL